MKKITMLVLALGLVGGSFCQENITVQLDEMLNSFTQRNKFNGTVLVAKRGRVLLSKGYGTRNEKLHALNDSNGIFRIYSITKTFTSTLILKLAEEAVQCASNAVLLIRTQAFGIEDRGDRLHERPHRV